MAPKNVWMAWISRLRDEAAALRAELAHMDRSKMRLILSKIDITARLKRELEAEAKLKEVLAAGREGMLSG